MVPRSDLYKTSSRRIALCSADLSFPAPVLRRLGRLAVALCNAACRSFLSRPSDRWFLLRPTFWLSWDYLQSLELVKKDENPGRLSRLRRGKRLPQRCFQILPSSAATPFRIKFSGSLLPSWNVRSTWSLSLLARSLSFLGRLRTRYATEITTGGCTGYVASMLCR